MKVIDFYNALCEIYPESLRASWDNDGLMCCPDTENEVKKVLCALDATNNTLQYAARGGFDTVLVHHPLIFRPISSVTELECVPRRVTFALTHGITVISLHTRLDAGKDGVNETLASLLDLSDITVFGDSDTPTLGRMGTTDITSPEEFAKAVKISLHAPFVDAYIGNRELRRVAVVGGAGADLYEEAKAAGADALVTGDVKYNCCLDARDSGISVFAAGHYYTEFPVTATLKKLSEDIAGAECEIFADTCGSVI